MIQVIETGLYSSVQDLGRPTWHSIGIPESGAMDMESAKTANTVLQNELHCSVLEITMTGPILQFTAPTWVAFSGAAMPIYIDQQKAQQNTPIWVKEGQEIRFGILEKGLRLYMAVKGGFKTTAVLGSQSMYKGITPHHMLQKGMELQHKSGEKEQKVFLKITSQTPLSTPVLKAFKGPEFVKLNPEQQTALEKTAFKVSNLNNRMAYQLTPALTPHQILQLTTPVLPGTVQITPKGTLMVLMRDGQTTGGYPRVLQLSEKSINALAQLKTGDSFQFKIIPL